MRILYLDCFSGISGDMTVGALLDAGADREVIFRALESLPVSGFHVSAEKTVKNGIAATQFHVRLDPDGDQPHRHLPDVVDIINGADLPEPVKSAAIETFELLADAEGAVHGISRDKVHFHEVGAVDAIVDIIAAQYGFHLLGPDAVYASPIHVGSGTVKCAHGIMPVPAPATAKLLENKPVRIGTANVELVTPTGAALLTQRVTGFGAIPEMAVTASGCGCGTRNLPDRANVLRVLIGESTEKSGGEEVLVVETFIDDMNPEFYPVVMEQILALGARDVFITQAAGKKGRPAHLLTLLCDEAVFDEISACLFRETTTFGLRFRRESRRILDRTWLPAETPWGTVRVKRGSWQGESMTLAPEFEDCRKLASDTGIPARRIYEAALEAARKHVNKTDTDSGPV
jgi:pyridinium-3,5-bisthiocarboxylic acid mononucleotide nickel chelatase